ncbi:MAG TPA: hypothetical protein VER32_12215 [Pyrinomonadaceae bacterium]|nr:hypothetical protein [Pyrinomonadaceae bacterium]
MNLRAKSALRRACGAFALLVALGPAAHAQSDARAPKKLPAPEKIVEAYLKAIGGKKRVAAIRDASYVWDVRGADGAEAGTARTHTKAPAASRADLLLDSGEMNSAANARTAWARGPDGILRTLTDREAYAARLHALLDAGRLADYKKQKVLARTAGVEDVLAETAYVVEFSTRAGARLRYSFGATSKLLFKVSDEARGLTLRLGDYRARDDAQILEPHRISVERKGEPSLLLTLREARYNAALSDALFEPPADAALDVAALLRDLERNQREVDRRVNDYTFTRKVTERKVNDRGEVTKETVTVHEVYPVAGWGWVMKLVSENGAALAPERAAREERRVTEELEKAERELPKLEQKRERQKAERAAKREAQKRKAGGASADEGDEDDIGIATFLRATELVAPRSERFRERDAVVFDFRPRAGFKAKNRAESVVSKLAGTVWIDPADRHVMRLEAHFAEGFKMGGGLLASIKPGSAFVFEQARMPDGVWLPRFSQVNLSAKVFLFAGVTVNATHEFSDYKRFSTKTDDGRLDAPKEPEKQ